MAEHSSTRSILAADRTTGRTRPRRAVLNRTNQNPKRRRLGPTTRAVLAVTVVTLGAGAAATSAVATPWLPPEPIHKTVEVFSETLKPWDSTRIPAVSCPASYYLIDQDFSPGRALPRGVEVVEPGGVGVSIGGVSYVSDHTYALKTIWVANGTTGTSSSATNWALSDREVVVKLHCTNYADQSDGAPWQRSQRLSPRMRQPRRRSRLRLPRRPAVSWWRG